MIQKLPQWFIDLKPTKRDMKLRDAAGLTPKRDGYYKSLGGRTRYICKPMPVRDAIKMLEAKKRQQPAGIVRRRLTIGALTIERLVELFLEDCWARVETGTPKKLDRRTFDDYEDTLARFCAAVGLNTPASAIGPDEFTAFIRTLDGRAGTTVRREIQYVDRLFNWAGPGTRAKNLIPYAQRGPNWVKPSARGQRDKSYAIPRVQHAFGAVAGDPLLNAAVHLGYGSGFIPKDLATLRDDQVDLDTGVIVFPEGRGKTGMSRLCPLHPLGIAALREYREQRPAAKPEADGLFFRTATGLPLARRYEGKRSSGEDNLVKKRWFETFGGGWPFTGLRTTLASLLDDWHDQRAVDVILGHSSTERAKHIRTVHYARQFNPERARAAVDYAYAQVFYGPVRPPAPQRSAASEPAR